MGKGSIWKLIWALLSVFLSYQNRKEKPFSLMRKTETRKYHSKDLHQRANWGCGHAQCTRSVWGPAKKKLVLVVIAGDGLSLFGRNWLNHITLNWKKVFAVRTLRLESLNKLMQYGINRYFQKDWAQLNHSRQHFTYNLKPNPAFSNLTQFHLPLGVP